MSGWFQSKWVRGGQARTNPTRPGWYAAVPESCDRCVVKVYLTPNLLNVEVEGDNLSRDVYDFAWWYPLKSENDRLPSFNE